MRFSPGRSVSATAIAAVTAASLLLGLVAPLARAQIPGWDEPGQQAPAAQDWRSASGLSCPRPSSGTEATETFLRRLNERMNQPCIFDLANWVDLVQPKRACGEYRKEILDYYDRCVSKTFLDQRDSEPVVVVRWQQLKLLYGQELFYLARIPPGFPGYSQLWKDFKKRWRERLANDPAVRELELSKKLGDDRCALTKGILSVSCSVDPVTGGLLPGAGKGDDEPTLPMAKEFFSKHAELAGSLKYPHNMTSELVKSVFFLKTLESLNPGFDPRTIQEALELSRQPEEARTPINTGFLRNYIYTYYPELTHDGPGLDGARYVKKGDQLEKVGHGPPTASLSTLGERALGELGNIDEMHRKFDVAWEAQVPEMEAQIQAIRLASDEQIPNKAEMVNQLMLSRRNGIIDGILSEAYAKKKVDSDLSGRIEAEFRRAHEDVLAERDKEVQLGKADPQWLFRQEHLVSPSLTEVADGPLKKYLGPMQASLCGKLREQREHEEFKANAFDYGSAAMLIPMIGSIVRAGTLAGAICLRTMIGMGVGMSILDAATAQADYEKYKSLFLSKVISYDTMELARSNRNLSILFGTLMVGFNGGNAALGAALTRRAEAVAAGDIEQVIQIDRTITRTRWFNRAIDASFTLSSLSNDDNLGTAQSLAFLGLGELQFKLHPLDSSMEKRASVLERRATAKPLMVQGGRTPGLWSEEFRSWMRELPPERQAGMASIWGELPSGRIGHLPAFEQRSAAIKAGRVDGEYRASTQDLLERTAKRTLKLDPNQSYRPEQVKKAFNRLEPLYDRGQVSEFAHRYGMPESVAAVELERQRQALAAAYGLLRP